MFQNMVRLVSCLQGNGSISNETGRNKFKLKVLSFGAYRKAFGRRYLKENRGARERLSSISKFENSNSLRIKRKLLSSESRVIDFHRCLVIKARTLMTGSKELSCFLMTSDKG